MEFNRGDYGKLMTGAAGDVGVAWELIPRILPQLRCTGGMTATDGRSTTSRINWLSCHQLKFQTMLSSSGIA